MARRIKSLHHNLQEGENVVFHREHRSPRNRSFRKKRVLQNYDRAKRHEFKVNANKPEFLEKILEVAKKKRKF